MAMIEVVVTRSWPGVTNGQRLAMREDRAARLEKSGFIKPYRKRGRKPSEKQEASEDQGKEEKCQKDSKDC